MFVVINYNSAEEGFEVIGPFSDRGLAHNYVVKQGLNAAKVRPVKSSGNWGQR